MEKLRQILKRDVMGSYVLISVFFLVGIICMIYLIIKNFHFNTENEITYGVCSICFLFLSSVGIVYVVFACLMPVLKDYKLFKQGIYEQVDAVVVKKEIDRKIILTTIRNIENGDIYKFEFLAKTEIGKTYTFYYVRYSKLIVFEPISKNK